LLLRQFFVKFNHLLEKLGTNRKRVVYEIVV
jgi:hypothetical protein